MNPLAKETVELIRRLGMKTAVATLPVFPADAITARIEWSGVPLSSFEFYTSYETCTACKPDPDYYREILTKQGGKAGDYLMVGNNVDEDMIAESVGMKVFLLTDCLINEHDRDISVYPRGGFRELQEYLKVPPLLLRACGGSKTAKTPVHEVERDGKSGTLRQNRFLSGRRRMSEKAVPQKGRALPLYGLMYRGKEFCVLRSGCRS